MNGGRKPGRKPGIGPQVWRGVLIGLCIMVVVVLVIVAVIFAQISPSYESTVLREPVRIVEGNGQMVLTFFFADTTTGNGTYSGYSVPTIISFQMSSATPIKVDAKLFAESKKGEK